MSTPFSKRHGYARQKIVARESAPKQLRSDILFAINELIKEWRPRLDRIDLCNWLEPVLKLDSSALYAGKFDKQLMECPWFRFYDCIEATYEFLTDEFRKIDPKLIRQFEGQVNEALEESGVGWKLVKGQLRIREDEGFEQSFQSALKSLESRGLSVAASEMREALNDLSRRPKPDATGAIHHAVASLESVARERAGNRKATLGQLVRKLRLQPPLDVAVDKIWGYASEFARHGREGKRPSGREAALVVGTCAAVAAFLAKVDE